MSPITERFEVIMDQTLTGLAKAIKAFSAQSQIGFQGRTS